MFGAVDEAGEFPPFAVEGGGPVRFVVEDTGDDEALLDDIAEAAVAEVAVVDPLGQLYVDARVAAGYSWVRTSVSALTRDQRAREASISARFAVKDALS